RFASADSIVPDPANPQSYNRYSYVLNRVLNFTDPTGHRECGAFDGCSGEALPALPLPTAHLPPYFIPDMPPFDIFPVNLSNISGVQGFGPTQISYDHRQGTSDEWYRQLGNIHSGIDIPLETGTDLVALGEGTIRCMGVDCGLSNNNDGADGLGIAIYYPSCDCVVYYVHLETISVEGGDVTKGQVIGTSGESRHGYAHLHFELRPYEGSATWYNPLYFFTPDILSKANLSFTQYRNFYNEWSFYGYTSKQNGEFGKYWIGTLPRYWID
ncbi:MAG: peptidoglycan DD-metalloendopeptidase family protein, partial [Anaerolineales bacterium]|nr:peptidoglycan DD-metalloendopeptidase family protein [Anaerolineales bacterium]